MVFDCQALAVFKSDLS